MKKIKDTSLSPSLMPIEEASAKKENSNTKIIIGASST